MMEKRRRRLRGETQESQPTITGFRHLSSIISLMIRLERYIAPKGALHDLI